MKSKISSGRCLIQSIFATAPKSKLFQIRRESCRLQTMSRFSTSVSESEVQKFSALHSEWWDPKKNPLIQMNTVRVQYIREQVAAQAFNSNNQICHHFGDSKCWILVVVEECCRNPWLD